ncbi:MAG: hypothetical protein DRN30_04170 [Thermoplasmata archaeon]|nr:MAG: hypothetical protein DRN30_04170 [Thermoplasmata archaeon]
MTKTEKKVRAKKPRSPVKIDSEQDFHKSLKLGSNKPGILINSHSTIISGTMVCSCGLSHVKVQGAHGRYLACDSCGTWYALSGQIDMVKMTKAQKEYIQGRYSVNID